MVKKSEEEEKLFNFFMKKSLKTELAIIAARDGTTLKEILNELAEDYAKKHKEGNDQHLMSSYLENEDFAGFPSMGIDFINKKNYINTYLQKDGRLNDLGKDLWGHILQWQSEMQKL